MIELLSLIAYSFPPLATVAFFVILGTILILGFYKIEYCFYALLAELCIGGLGHLFSLDISGIHLSIRMGLFLIIIAVWIVQQIRNKKSRFDSEARRAEIRNQKLSKTLLISYLLFLISITYGLINGLLHNELSNVFFDFNAWIYFALLPAFFTIVKKENWENILQVLTGATTYLA